MSCKVYYLIQKIPNILFNSYLASILFMINNIQVSLERIIEDCKQFNTSAKNWKSNLPHFTMQQHKRALRYKTEVSDSKDHFMHTLRFSESIKRTKKQSIIQNAETKQISLSKSKIKIEKAKVKFNKMTFPVNASKCRPTQRKQTKSYLSTSDASDFLLTADQIAAQTKHKEYMNKIQILRQIFVENNKRQTKILKQRSLRKMKYDLPNI